MSKFELRQKFLQIRKELSSLRRRNASSSLLERLTPLCADYEGIASFANTKHEIDLSALNQILAKERRLFLPRVEGELLQFYLVANLERQMVVNGCLMEPDPDLCERINLTERHLLLVPAIAFDHENYRLGYGLGCYDRFLSQHPKVTTLGVGFREQLSTQILPRDSWDRPVQSICLF